MLQRIRDNIQGWLAKVIIAIIVIPFAVFGIDAFFGGSSNPDVAEVNGQNITTTQLNEAIYLQKREILSRSRGTVSADQIDDSVLRKPAMQSLIQRTLMQQAAAKLGLAVRSKVVDQYIVQMPEFQQDGKFSSDRYRALLRGQGMSPAAFKDNVHNALVANQLMSFYTNATVVTDAQIRRAAAILAQKRDIAWAVLPMAAARQQVTVSDDDLRAYYSAHKSDYRTPEEVAVNYILIGPKDFYPKIPEAEIRSAYQDEVRTEQAKTQRRASHILIATSAKVSDADARAKAEAIRQQIEHGADFAALARKDSDDKGSAGQGGDLGYSDGSVFPPPFEKALAKLKVGAISQPVKTDAGWHLIKLTDIRKPKVEPYAQAKERLRKQLQQMKAKNIFAAKEERLADLSFNAPDLASVAKQMDLKVRTSPFFSRKGADGGLFARDDIVKAAFSKIVMKEGANSDVIDLPDGRAIVVRLAQHKPPRQLAFTDVRDTIHKKLVLERARSRLHDQANAIIAQLQKGATLESIAKADKLGYRSVQGVVRSRTNDVPSAIEATAFGLPPAGSGVSAGLAALGDGDVAVTVVAGVQPGSVDDLSLADKQQLKQLLQQYRASRHASAYQSGLHAGAKIKLL